MLLAKKKSNSVIGTNGLVVDNYLFTRCGAELYSVIEKDDSSEFDEIVDVFNEEYKDFEFIQARLVSREGNQIRYSIAESEVNFKTEK